MLDKGYSLDPVRSVLKAYSGWIDVWKLGWGTAYIEPALAEKIRPLRDHQVKPCTGGTLLEIAWLQDRVDGVLRLRDLGRFRVRRGVPRRARTCR